ncbi:hypothetical protein GF406_13095 [candidate division KSB1 bacterium]|jgi:hypothetical protein|nr:hypothetical protein [candidate division KSB1 bacterium]
MTDQTANVDQALGEKSVAIRLGSMTCEEIKAKIREVIDKQKSLGWIWIGMTCQGTTLHLQFKELLLL